MKLRFWITQELNRQVKNYKWSHRNRQLIQEYWRKQGNEPLYWMNKYEKGYFYNPWSYKDIISSYSFNHNSRSVQLIWYLDLSLILSKSISIMASKKYGISGCSKKLNNNWTNIIIMTWKWNINIKLTIYCGPT